MYARKNKCLKWERKMLYKFPNQKYITMNIAYSDILNISHF